MKAKGEQSEVVKRALAMLRSPILAEPQGGRDPEPMPDRETEPEHLGPEALTVAVLAEFEPDEAGRIVTAWQEILGINLDTDRVRDHLAGLKKWQASLSAGRRMRE